MAASSQRAIFAALAANLGLAIAKFAGWLLTGAASMLAEAVHSLADVTNQLLLLWGGAAAKRAPTAAHPFGHGRERYFWSFVVAIVIFTLGGLFALYEGVEKFLHPHPVNAPQIAIAILLLGIALEGMSLRTAMREARPLKQGRSWWRYIRATKQPELPVVLLEDLAALLGLMIALIGVSTAAITGDGMWDGLGSIAIAGLLMSIATILAVEMKSLLIGEAVSADHERQIVAAMASVPRFERLIHMRTQHIGPEQILVGAKVQLDAALDFALVTEVIDEIETSIRASVPAVRVIYIEPDIYEPTEPDNVASPQQ
jgi:cation diffusion facilitator family transporter